MVHHHVLAAAFPADWAYGFFGGLLIGFASLLAMAASGKVPGISGIFAKVLRPHPGDWQWRALFLVGLVAGAGALISLSKHAAGYQVGEGRHYAVYAIAGLLVGFGTRLGGGCTSGHGICGMGACARDSIVATLTFMAAAILTVLAWKLILGGGHP